MEVVRRTQTPETVLVQMGLRVTCQQHQRHARHIMTWRHRGHRHLPAIQHRLYHTSGFGQQHTVFSSRKVRTSQLPLAVLLCTSKHHIRPNWRPMWKFNIFRHSPFTSYTKVVHVRTSTFLFWWKCDQAETELALTRMNRFAVPKHCTTHSLGSYVHRLVRIGIVACSGLSLSWIVSLWMYIINNETKHKAGALPCGNDRVSHEHSLRAKWWSRTFWRFQSTQMRRQRHIRGLPRRPNSPAGVASG